MKAKLSSNSYTDTWLSEIIQEDWRVCDSEARHYNSTVLHHGSLLRHRVDMALNQGPSGTNSLQALYQELTRLQFKPHTVTFVDGNWMFLIFITTLSPTHL